MILNSKNIESIKNRQVTFVKGFSVDELYDMNKLTTFIDNYSMDVLCLAQHENFFRQVLQIKYINEFDDNVAVMKDFLQKTFKYRFNAENGVDIFFSLVANTGSSHVDKEDVFLIGSYGKTTYRMIPEGIDYQIKKGDLLYIPRGIRHRSFSNTPRAVISIGFFE
jgi:ribosomal protein L16 Arg81 hydroxylase